MGSKMSSRVIVRDEKEEKITYDCCDSVVSASSGGWGWLVDVGFSGCSSMMMIFFIIGHGRWKRIKRLKKSKWL